MQMIRCLFVLSDLESGGAQRVLLTVLKQLDRAAFEPHLAVADTTGPLYKELPGNAAIHFLGSSRVRYLLPALHRLVRKVRPRVVVSTLGHLNLALLASKGLFPKGTRLVVREANTPSARLAQTSHPTLYRWGFRTLYPRADRVLCNAAFMKEDLVNGFSVAREKAAVVPNPVDTGRILGRVEGAENPYPKGGEGPQIVSVGRLTHQKGYDLLAKVMKEATVRFPSLHLTIVGDGPEKEALEGLSTELGLGEKVTFAGHRDNPYPFMAHADLFISSSRYEGSPNAVLESLACGTPVLAFDCPGGTREIISEGKNGWLVPAEEVGAMAAKLVDLIRSRAWETMASKRLLPKAFECRNAVRAYESVLLKCARGEDSGL